MIDQAFFEYIKTKISETIKYGSAENVEAPYCVMRKISDNETRDILCRNQGKNGEALFQFSCYTGLSAPESLLYAQSIKNKIAVINGDIGSNFYIDLNITSGATILSEGENNNLVWGSIFESKITWREYGV